MSRILITNELFASRNNHGGLIRFRYRDGQRWVETRGGNHLTIGDILIANHQLEIVIQ